MSKGFHDKRQELAHETQIKQALNRIKRGFKAIFGSWRKLLLLALCEAAAALLGLFMYPSAGSFLAPLTGLLVLLLTLLLLLACPIALAWAWGGPWHAGAIADDMTRAGMVNSAGEPPALESIKRDKKNTNIKVLLFDTCGLPPEEWLKNLAKMQSVLNGTILRISYGGDNRHVMVHLGPPQTELPTNITMRAFLQPVEPTKLVLGMPMNEMERKNGERMSGYGSGSEYMPMTKQMAMEWVKGLENEDGSRGPHWTMEQTNTVMAQKHVEADPIEFFLAMNLTYSDLCKEFQKNGINKIDAYVDFAKAFWLCDKDVPDKLSRYYAYLVQ